MTGPVDFLVRMLAPDAGTGAYNDWRLVSTSTLPTWALVGLGALLVIALGASLLGLRRLSPGRRVLLMTLRALAGVWVLLVLLEPAIELRAVSKVRTRIALAVDTSRSMSLATKDGTRAEAVAEHLERSQPALAALAERATIQPFTFGERAHLLERLPEPLPSDETRTDLGKALTEIASQSVGQELGAIILYSDGVDTQGLTPDAARKKAAKLGVPIYTVGFPEDSAAADLAIRRVLADDFAFVHNTVVIEVELEERGLGLDSVVATLKQDGQVVQSKPATFAGGLARVSFEFKPRTIGKQVFQISVPIQRGENVETNNERSLVLKVIRDRIRVLQVAGRPSWDERFLREMLKRNPNVDLISFFILRSTTDEQKASPDELALIPFPVNDLFTTELPSFDVVIYQNFSYRPYRMAHYLRNVRDYVQKGGAFLMIGGDFGFEDGWYSDTPISEILPVQLGGAPPWDTAEYRPRLSKEGRRHPITRIGEPGEPPDAVFRRLPMLSGFNNSLGLAPGSQALLEHPGLPGNPPVVAVRETGGGRTMAVATDSIWFWRFLAVGDGGAGREFDRFWSNSLRWLIRDPELARVRVKAEHSAVLKGDPVVAEVQVLGPDYRGQGGAKVTATLLAVDGEKGTNAGSAEATTGPEGAAMISFGDVPPGTYIIRASAEAEGEPLGKADEPVIVEAADVELEATFPRPEVLKALAEGSGGQYIDIGDKLPDLEIEDARKVEVDRTRRIPVWDTFFALTVLVGLAASEWWLRRRAGLL
jgi:uncharacterized membrane protein